MYIFIHVQQKQQYHHYYYYYDDKQLCEKYDNQRRYIAFDELLMLT
jgi:hypothetical protein